MSDNVKFKRGTQQQYDTAKQAGNLIENALYFTTDTHRLFLGEHEVSTPLRVTGIDDGSSDWNFPAAYNEDSFATITDELSTGEIHLGSAATMNVIKQFGPEDYYQPSANGNKYVPSAAAVYQLVSDNSGISVGADQHFSEEFSNWADLANRSQKNKLHRYFGPTSTIPAEYVATPGYGDAEPVEMHYGDYYIVYETIINVENEETGENFSTKRNKFLPIFQSTGSEESTITLDKEYQSANTKLNIQLKKDGSTVSAIEIPTMVGTPSHGGGQGKTGLVPATSDGDQNKFLRGDGTWASPESMPYGQADTVDTEYVDIDGEVIHFTRITVRTQNNILTYKYCIITFPQDYNLLEDSQYIEFLNISTSTTVPAFPYYKGERATFIPKGTWMFVQSNDSNQHYEVVGSFGREWDNP